MIKTRNKYIRRLIYLLLILLFLIFISFFLIRLPVVQNFAKDKILQSLSEKYNAEWSIGDIRVKFFDSVEATDILFLDQQSDTLISAEKIDLDIDLFSLFSKQLSLDKIELNKARVKVSELSSGKMNYDFLIPKSNADTTTKEESSNTWNIDLSKIELNHSKIDYITTSEEVYINNEKLDISINNFDLSKKQLSAKDISAAGLCVNYVSSSKETTSSQFEFPNIDWNLSGNQIKVSDSEFLLSNDTDETVVKDINMDLSNISYHENSGSIDIQQLQANINNQIELSKAQVNISVENNIIQYNNLEAQTNLDEIKVKEGTIDINQNIYTLQNPKLKLNHSTLLKIKPHLPSSINLEENANLDLIASYISYSQENLTTKKLKFNYGNAIYLNGDTEIKTTNNQFANPQYINTDFTSIDVNLPLLDRILNDIKIPDSLSRYKNLTASGHIDGNLQTLNINNLFFAVDEVLSGNATGNINNLDNAEKLSYNLSLQKLIADVEKLPIPINDKIAIDSLGILKFDGTVIGSTSQLKINGKMLSDLGELDANMDLDITDGIENLRYNGALSLEKFNAGTFLNNSELDEVTISTNIEGQGINIENMDSKISGKIKDFSYLGYPYDEVIIDANVKEKSINGTLSLNDKNLALSYSGIIDITKENTILDFTTTIDTLNLMPLNFLDRDVSVRGTVISKFALPLRIGEIGNIQVTDLSLSNQNESYYEDTINLKALKTIDSTFVTVESDAITLSIDGDYDLQEIPIALASLVNNYMGMESNENISSNSMHVAAVINTLQPLDIIMCDTLIQTKSIVADMDINYLNNHIEGSAIIDSLFYNELFSEKIDIETNTANGELQVIIAADNNKYKGIEIPIITIINSLQAGKLNSKFTAKEKDKLPRLQFSTLVQMDQETLSITMKDSMILNSKNWIVKDGNNIQLHEGKYNVDNFELTDNNEFLRIQSQTDNGNNINLEFENFNINQFITLLTGDDSGLSGHIDGTIEINDLLQDIYYIANLSVKDIVYDSTAVGVLTINADVDPKTDILYSDLSLIGPSNNVVGNGTYDIGSTEADFNLDLGKLEFRLLDPFLSDIISRSEGTLSGNAVLQGKIKNPNVEGSVTLDKVVTTIVANNSRYGIDEHTLSFDNNSIDIGILDIFDKDDNYATLTGNIYHDRLRDVIVDIVVETSKFTFLNTSTVDNPVFHGHLMLDAVGMIYGPPDLLDVDVTAKTLEDSDITISPFAGDQYTLEEEFITYGKPEEFIDLTDEYLLKLAQQYPFNVNLLLDATDDIKLTMVVDPLTGDKIVGNGNGDLRIKLNPDGQQEIFGTYTVNEGTYNFSYGDLVNKEFIIESGGTIRFNGNPLDAILDIDAKYRVYTSTYELVKNNLPPNSDESNTAKKRTNVDVNLSFEGTLDQPEINLDIQVPDLQSSSLVTTLDLKLNELRDDPNELNKQVFGLLIFDSFILSNTNASGIGSISGNLALGSISGLISNQLNNLAEKVIRGVDVNFNFNTYDSDYVNNGNGGNVTEIGLQVSKQLFNDRLSISATGNLNLSENSGSGAYTGFLGDFVLEYKLTENGKYRVRVFSKSDYDRLLNENTNRNGVSLFFKNSFDSKIKQ